MRGPAMTLCAVHRAFGRRRASHLRRLPWASGLLGGCVPGLGPRIWRSLVVLRPIAPVGRSAPALLSRWRWSTDRAGRFRERVGRALTLPPQPKEDSTAVRALCLAWASGEALATLRQLRIAHLRMRMRATASDFSRGSPERCMCRVRMVRHVSASWGSDAGSSSSPRRAAGFGSPACAQQSPSTSVMDDE